MGRLVWWPYSSSAVCSGPFTSLCCPFTFLFCPFTFLSCLYTERTLCKVAVALSKPQPFPTLPSAGADCRIAWPKRYISPATICGLILLLGSWLFFSLGSCPFSSLYPPSLYRTNPFANFAKWLWLYLSSNYSQLTIDNEISPRLGQLCVGMPAEATECVLTERCSCEPANCEPAICWRWLQNRLAWLEALYLTC